MKKIIPISLLCAMCALQSCETSTEFKEVEKIVYQDPTYDVKSISLSENSLLFKTKETALKSKTITINIEGEEGIPTTACNVNSLDEDVATAVFNENGKVVITPVNKGTTKVVVSLQNKVTSCTVEVRTTYFDLAFAQQICDSYEDFTLGEDGDIDVVDNADAIAAMTDLYVGESHLTSLNGVEYLTALEVLNCSKNHLSSLDVTKCTQLKELDCSNNFISSLDVTKLTQLEDLYCNYNSITSLDVTQCPLLATFMCKENSLSQLDVAKCTKLEMFNCYGNSISQLDVTKCTQLKQFDCSENSLSQLDVTQCPILTNLYCNKNAISQLDVTQCPQLVFFECSNNYLSLLDISMCDSIRWLQCGDQKSGELTLSLTNSQNTGIWNICSVFDFNGNVTTVITDATPQ